MTDAGYQMMMRYYLQTATGVKVVVLAFLYPRFEKVGGILVYICPWFHPSFLCPSVIP